MTHFYTPPKKKTPRLTKIMINMRPNFYKCMTLWYITKIFQCSLYIFKFSPFFFIFYAIPHYNYMFLRVLVNFLLYLFFWWWYKWFFFASLVVHTVDILYNVNNVDGIYSTMTVWSTCTCMYIYFIYMFFSHCAKLSANYQNGWYAW